MSRKDAENVRGILIGINALFNWLGKRGLTRARAIQLLDNAEAEDRDLTTDEVQGELDALSSELDETERLIDGD